MNVEYRGAILEPDLVLNACVLSMCDVKIMSDVDVDLSMVLEGS